MWALTADADFLAQRGQGQVEQVFVRAVNIALPARQQLLTLLCEEYDNAPNSCRLALTHFDDLFRHGDKVQFDDQGITVGQHLHIEMSRCRRWLSPTLQMTAVNFHLIAWQQWHDIIHQHLGENETLFNYRGLLRGRNNTTLLSAITLEAALQQRCRENIHRFIHNIIYGVPGNSTQAIEKIKHIGSSSGCDMLYGMADGCALSQTYGGNYVS
ncbi:TPA: DUF2877 domain-containing protein [Escherichia coli]|nr:DUF2877 domain-containing protein [Escherichia coli]HCO7663359.1 DUF2877 domain-containing protein [Escherichia coli]